MLVTKSIFVLTMKLVIVTMVCATFAVALGKPDLTTHEISGRVFNADGTPSEFAKLKLHAIASFQVDATTDADEAGRFAFSVRWEPSAKMALQMTVEGRDGKQIAIHSFSNIEEKRVLRDLHITLQAVRTLEVEVVDSQGVPIENAGVAFLLDTPDYPFLGARTDRNGLSITKIPENESIDQAIAWKDHSGLDYRLYRLNPNLKSEAYADKPEFPRDRPERFVLEGASPLKVKTISEKAEPIENVGVYPWILKKGGQADSLNLSFYSGVFSETTNAAGEAAFHWWPKWQNSGTVFWPVIEGYDKPRGLYEPARDLGELKITLRRLVPIRGRALDSNGKGIQGIKIEATGEGRSSNQFRGFVETDADGHYELLVAPNHAYMVVVKDSLWAAEPQTGFAVLPNKPVEGRDFQLRKGTRVHGRLLNRSNKEPVPNQRVIVYSYGTKLVNVGDAPVPVAEDPENWMDQPRQPIAHFYGTTDGSGRFEIALGDGDFDIRPPHQEYAQKFSISGEGEMEFAVLTKVHREVELLGLVVNDSNAQPIANAKLTGVPRSFQSVTWEAETGKDGKFTVSRRPELTYIHAISLDKKHVAIVEVEGLPRAFVIEMKPVGSAVGRLVDANKRPISGQKIDYGIVVPDVDKIASSNRLGGQVTTDSNGEFTMTSLVGGWEYELRLHVTPDGRTSQIGKLTTTSGEQFKLDDIQTQSNAPTSNQRD